MVKRSDKREEIFPKLRHVDVVHSQGRGMTIADAVRDIGVSEVKFYRWHEDHSGINAVQLTRIKAMEKAKVAPVFYNISPVPRPRRKRASTSTVQGALSPFS